MEEQLKLRMYFLVPYNISPVQQGIQSGHAALRYAMTFGRHDENHVIWDFIGNHETWVILNGGTTNDIRSVDDEFYGSLNQIADQLAENDIEYSYFREPDLNDTLTALCFIADERVFNRKDYPDFVDYILRDASAEEVVKIRMIPRENLIETNSEQYKEWIRLIGGKKNEFLRELLKDKRLA